MPQGETKGPPAKYWRLFELALAAIYAYSIATAFTVLRNPEWHPHLIRLFGRAWEVFIAQDVGSTSRGFLNGGIQGVITIIVVAAMIGYLHGFAELKKHVLETAIIALFAIPTVAVFVYGGQLAWEIAKMGYQDHHALASELIQARVSASQASSSATAGSANQIEQLRGKLATAQSELEVRKHTLFTTDPIFGNLIYLLQDFQIYRSTRSGKPCVIYITAMPDSAPLASVVAQFSGSVSGCSTFGPFPPGLGNPDLEDMTKQGMIPNVVVVHTQRDDSAGLQFQERLGNHIQARLSYTPAPIPRDHLYDGSRIGPGESFIWLQFGTGVQWNSERYGPKR